MSRISNKDRAAKLAVELGVQVTKEGTGGADFAVEVWARDVHLTNDPGGACHTAIFNSEQYATVPQLWAAVLDELGRLVPCPDDCECREVAPVEPEAPVFDPAAGDVIYLVVDAPAEPEPEPESAVNEEARYRLVAEAPATPPADMFAAIHDITPSLVGSFDYRDQFRRFKRGVERNLVYDINEQGWAITHVSWTATSISLFADGKSLIKAVDRLVEFCVDEIHIPWTPEAASL